MKLSATTRTETKTEGQVPGIIYGKTIKENISVYLAENEVRKAYKDIKNKETFTLDVSGTEYSVILQDMQVHVTSGAILNMDFLVQA